MAQLMRSDKVSYLDITPTTTATYTYMSAGFTDLTDSRSPDISKKIYINDTSDSATLRKYAPEWAFSFDRDSVNTVHAFLVDIGESQATGALAETTYVEFLSTDVNAITGLVDAYEYDVTVQVDSTGTGAGGEELVCSGVLHGNGDPRSGSWNTATNVFTADVS